MWEEGSEEGRDVVGSGRLYKVRVEVFGVLWVGEVNTSVANEEKYCGGVKGWSVSVSVSGGGMGGRGVNSSRSEREVSGGSSGSCRGVAGAGAHGCQLGIVCLLNISRSSQDKSSNTTSVECESVWCCRGWC